MSAFLEFLAKNPEIATTTIITICAVVIIVALMYIIAFLQGREITFWPPKIGSKAESPKDIQTSDITALGALKMKPNSQKLAIFNGSFGDHSISYVKDWKSIESEIAQKIEISNEVRLIQIKGRELYLDLPLKHALKSRANQGKPTWILLQAPNSKHISYDVSKEFEWKSLEKYIKDFEHSLANLADVMPNYKQVVRLYDFLPLLKLYIFDEEIFVSIYSGTVKDRDSKEVVVWRLSRKDDGFGIAKLIERLFEALWKESRSISLIRNSCVFLDESSYFMSIPVSYDKVGLSEEKLYFRNKNFSLKNELHITIIGSNLMSLIKEKLKTNRYQKDLFLRAIAETDWSYELLDKFYHLVKEADDISEKGKVSGESIIQMVHVPELEKFYGKLEAIIGEKILQRPTHVTIYTYGNQRGIGVNIQSELEKYSHGEVALDQLKNL